MVDVFGVMSDLHCHDWSAFSTLDSQGRNSRLMEIISEFHRCCAEVRKVGGHTVVICGDVFHTREHVKQSVFNPVRDAFAQEVSRGMLFLGIAGNHDLQSNESKELTSSAAMLRVGGVQFFHDPCIQRFEFGNFAFVPWMPSSAAAMDAISELASSATIEVGKCNLIVHLGIDGVLSNMPDHGVTADKLASFGFKRVWAGHYHHAKTFGGNVHSVGALTQQTWSDVRTKAGFWVVDNDNVKWHHSRAPTFLDIADLNPSTDRDDLVLEIDGHYVRAKIETASAADIAKWRNDLLDMGAKGVLIQTTGRTAIEKREGVSVKSLAALDRSVLDYVVERKMPNEVSSICSSIMKEISA